MSESLQKNKLYEYKANSNLVLEAERDKRRRDEGSAEVESLFGRLDGVKMGDRSGRSTDEGLILSKKPRVYESEEISAYTKVAVRPSDDKTETYRPKTRETKLIYEDILNNVANIIGDQPNDVVRGAVDEIISTLRDDRLNESVKRDEIQSIIGKISSDLFSRLLVSCKRLSDFSVQSENDRKEDKLDEEIGVAVIFDEDEEDMDNDDDVIMDEEESKNVSGVLKGDGNSSSASFQPEAHELLLSPQDVDGFWLQRQLSRYTPDANISASLAEDILSILAIPDERSVENKLAILIGFDNFDFIKILLRNRPTVYFCTRYHQAQSDDERKEIEEEMHRDQSGKGLTILQALNSKISAKSWFSGKITESTLKSTTQSSSTNDEVDEVLPLHDDENLVDGVSPSQEKSAQILDLDTLAFQGGAHFMSNESCKLPNKSWRALKKGYEEVHVPASRPVIPAGEVLAQISSLPTWCQPAFDGIKSLNRVQSKMLQSSLLTEENILLCAPTGAGKTNVALLCMLREIGKHLNDQGVVESNFFKVVYIAPMKALVQEVVLTFSKKLKPFGLTVNELSGDVNMSNRQLEETHLIVTTPEKWDVVTRKCGDRNIIQLVRLIIVDEIHLLHDDRGPVLEAIISRTLRYTESNGEPIRLVGLSATLPNFEDVAAFLRVDPSNGLFFFDQSFRPVPLQQQYIGITEKKAIKRYQLMNEICYEKVLQQAGKNQVLIFTHSRADTIKTAKALKDLAFEGNTLSSFLADDSASKEILLEESKSCKNVELKELLPFGFAIHHAGLLRSDRTLVEELFADRHIQVLVSTATLAWGVNLPCHTVIIKGTQIYSPDQGKWIEMSPLDILQMLGRAGRFGLDTEGEGIILTTHNELQYYLSLLNQQLPVESQLVKRLPDMLNAEVVLGNISTIRDAVDWLGYSFLYIRMLRNCETYGIQKAEIESDPILHKRRVDLAHTSATILEKHGLLKYDRKSGVVHTNSIGRIASYYYINHSSIKLYNEYMKPDMTEIEIFRLFSLSSEFKNIIVRDEEKLELTKLMTRVPIPIKESVDEPSAKANVLLQSYISRLKLEGFSLCADTIYIQQSAGRLLRCLFEISLRRGWASLSFRLLNICKIAEKRMWMSQSPLRQFTSIPEMILRKLEKSTDLNWSLYQDLKPQDLGEMVKNPKLGKTLHRFVHLLPKLNLSAKILPLSRSLLRIELIASPDFIFDINVHEKSILFWVFVHDVDGRDLLHYESCSVDYRKATQDILLAFVVPLREPISPQYFVKVVSDRWMASEATIAVSLTNIILPAKFPPCTELLDLQPLPIKSLKSNRVQSIYRDRMFFDPIQTQVFSALHDSASNVFIAAPSGCDLITCFEFSVLSLYAENPIGKCVYVSPKKEKCNFVYNFWKQRLAGALNIKLDILGNDTAQNLRLLESNQMIVTCVESLYALSKRWKQRKSIQTVNLFLFDEMYYLTEDDGSYEVLVSRIRYMCSQLENPARIVGASVTVANAKDFGDWIGATSSNVFNFPLNARSHQLEVRFVGFDNHDYRSRLQSMLKPAFHLLSNTIGTSLVFIGSSAHAKLRTIDYITYLKNKGHSHLDTMETSEASFDDVTLHNTIKFGVAYVTNDLSSKDQILLLNLFRNQIIRKIFVSYDAVRTLSVKADTVVLMDVVALDGESIKDYGVTELMNMLACVGGKENTYGNFYVLCHNSRKDILKKILMEPIPIESKLHLFLLNHMNSEIAMETIENKQDAVDFITWTFLYRRLALNPNYYNLLGSSHRHLSDYLSDAVEKVVSDLESMKCISVEDDFELRSGNLGMIANYYGISCSSIELFSVNITSKLKSRGILEIIVSSLEFNNVQIKDREWEIIDALLSESTSTTTLNESARKAFALIHAHLTRQSMIPSLHADLCDVVQMSVKLIPAIVDVISSKGWLKPALAAMELSQLLVQAIQTTDSVLLQVPHFNKAIIDRFLALESPVESIFDLIELDDSIRNEILMMNRSQLSDVALFCNSYPVVEVAYEISNTKVSSGETIGIQVSMNYDGDGPATVISPRFPFTRSLGWWLLVGDRSKNTLLSIKKLSSSQLKTSISFSINEIGKQNLTLYLINDSYVGCDQEFAVEVEIVE